MTILDSEIERLAALREANNAAIKTCMYRLDYEEELRLIHENEAIGKQLMLCLEVKNDCKRNEVLYSGSVS